MATHKLKRLQAKHQRIVELTLEGMSSKKIATEVGLTPQGVQVIQGSPVFQGELARRQESRVEAVVEETSAIRARRAGAKAILEEAAGDAAQTQVNLLESSDLSVRQRSAMDILDRTGFPKVTKAEVSSQSLTVSVSEVGLKRLMEATQEVFDETPDLAIEGQ